MNFIPKTLCPLCGPNVAAYRKTLCPLCGPNVAARRKY